VALRPRAARRPSRPVAGGNGEGQAVGPGAVVRPPGNSPDGLTNSLRWQGAAQVEQVVRGNVDRRPRRSARMSSLTSHRRVRLPLDERLGVLEPDLVLRPVAAVVGSDREDLEGGRAVGARSVQESAVDDQQPRIRASAALRHTTSSWSATSEMTPNPCGDGVGCAVGTERQGGPSGDVDSGHAEAGTRGVPGRTRWSGSGWCRGCLRGAPSWSSLTCHWLIRGERDTSGGTCGSSEQVVLRAR